MHCCRRKAMDLSLRGKKTHRKSGAFLVMPLQLGTCFYQSLAGFVAGVLHEILNEATSQILSLALPLSNIGVSISGVQNCGVHTGQAGGNIQSAF